MRCDIFLFPKLGFEHFSDVPMGVVSGGIVDLSLG